MYWANKSMLRASLQSSSTCQQHARETVKLDWGKRVEVGCKYYGRVEVNPLTRDGTKARVESGCESTTLWTAFHNLVLHANRPLVQKKSSERDTRLNR
jgi:hypothetical protein